MVSPDLIQIINTLAATCVGSFIGSLAAIQASNGIMWGVDRWRMRRGNKPGEQIAATQITVTDELVAALHRMDFETAKRLIPIPPRMPAEQIDHYVWTIMHLMRMDGAHFFSPEERQLSSEWLRSMEEAGVPVTGRSKPN